MSSRDKLQCIIHSKLFKTTSKVLGVIFLILTVLVAVQPDSFAKFSYPGIFIYNVLGSGFVIIPLLASKMNVAALAFSSGLGNCVSTSINYFVGNSSHGVFANITFVSTIKNLMKKFGFAAVYVLAMIPLPVDIVGLLAGYLDFPYKQYVMWSFLGRVTVYFLIGYGFLALK
jgi:membrane protein YqaA with SNARE-associated domain